MYIYEDHLNGNLYSTTYELSWKDLYCETCDDTDVFIGEYDSWEDFIKSVDPTCNFYHSADEIAALSGFTVEEVYKFNSKFKEAEEAEAEPTEEI